MSTQGICFCVEIDYLAGALLCGAVLDTALGNQMHLFKVQDKYMYNELRCQNIGCKQGTPFI